MKEFTREELEWLLRMCKRALLLAQMNLEKNKYDPGLMEALISKLEERMQVK